MAKKGSWWLMYGLVFGLVLLTISVVVMFYISKTTTPDDYVCMPKQTFQKMTEREPEREAQLGTHGQEQQQAQVTFYQTGVRDRKVLSDPLYPPLNRTDRTTFESVVAQTDARNMNVPSNDIGDTFRLVGYLTNDDAHKDVGGNHWKLMAREKNRHESEFYIIPTNKNYDVKVALTQDVVSGTRLRDIYSIPTTITFNSPMLNDTPYKVVEIPKTSFSDRYF